LERVLPEQSGRGGRTVRPGGDCGLRPPPEIAGHSKTQDFYFGPDFLSRRHDCRVEASGGFAAAQYVYEPVAVEGITFPTKRRAYMKDDRKFPIHEKLMVSIDIANLRLT
jgi:hypothetical protein